MSIGKKMILIGFLILGFLLMIKIFDLFCFENYYAQKASCLINKDSIQYSNWLIVLDPAHGKETAGKRSPDGKFREWKFSREILQMLSEKFDSAGINYAYSNNKSDKEIGLSNRRKITNALVKNYKGKSLLISVHANASGNGVNWQKARGFSVWTTHGITRSDVFAQILSDNWNEIFYLKNLGLFEANFAVLRCNGSAVLIEFLFQDNLQDVEILLDDNYRRDFVQLIFNSVIQFIKLYN